MLVSSSVAEKLAKYTLYNTVTLHFPLNSDIDDIESSNIMLSSLELSKELMDGSEFKFGGCVASEMKIKLLGYSDSAALVGETVQVKINTTYYNVLYPAIGLYPQTTLYPKGHSSTISTPIFYGKIESAERGTKNRNVVQITAYDAFYDMAKYDAKLWFIGDVSTKGKWEKLGSGITFTDVFAELKSKAETFGITGVENYGNTGFITGSGVDVNVLDCTAKSYIRGLSIDDITLVDLIQAYAELKLTFATINPKGQLAFTPLGSSVCQTIKSYKDLTFENYEVADIEMLTISYLTVSTPYTYEEEYKLGYSNEMSWYNMDNFFVRYSSDYESSTDVNMLGQKYNSSGALFGSACVFRPAEVTLFSYWWLEPGDKIEIETPFDDVGTITTFVINKQMTGFETTLKSEGERLLGKETDETEDDE